MEIVVMDMSDSYRALVKLLFPKAKVVADKFHVLRLLNPSLIKHRAEIHGHRKELRYRRLILSNEKGFNNVAKLVQKRAYGVKSFKMYRLRYLNACA